MGLLFKYTGQMVGTGDVGKKPPAKWEGKVEYDNKRRKFNKKK